MNQSIKVFTVGLALAFASCNDAKLPPLVGENADPDSNAVYFSEAVLGAGTTISFSSQAVSTSLTVRLAQPATRDITITVDIDADVVEEYNAAYEKNLQALTSEHVQYDQKVVIPKGSASQSVKFVIEPFETNGESFALGVKLKNVIGTEILASASSYVWELKEPLTQLVPVFEEHSHRSNPNDPNSAGFFDAMQPAQSWEMKVFNFTLEWWSRVSRYSINNQCIFENMSKADDVKGSTELYVRFGDVIHPSEYGYKYLQVKSFGAQFDTEPSVSLLVPQQWYHFAITYDASTGQMLLYKNGEVCNQLDLAKGIPLDLKGFNCFGIDDSFSIAQIRFWMTTRTAQQIKDNMRFAVSPQNPDLLFYLPMTKPDNLDGGATTYFTDVTGNGHDLPSGGRISDWETVDFSAIDLQ